MLFYFIFISVSNSHFQQQWWRNVVCWVNYFYKNLYSWWKFLKTAWESKTMVVKILTRHGPLKSHFVIANFMILKGYLIGVNLSLSRWCCGNKYVFSVNFDMYHWQPHRNLFPNSFLKNSSQTCFFDNLHFWLKSASWNLCIIICSSIW